jgi:hypothetical protein
VTLPTKENIGIESSRFSKWKYLYWSNLLAARWSGAAASNYLSLEAIGIPFGKAKGSGFCLSSQAKEELLRRSSL